MTGVADDFSRLIEADGGAGRFLALTLQSMDAAHAVYVHIKVAVVDDHWLTIGSANLNTHSLFNDTEVNLIVRDPDVARSTRERLCQEHTGQKTVGDNPVRFIDEVHAPLAKEQSRRAASDLGPTAKVRLLDHVTRRSDLVLVPLSSVLVDG